VAGEEGRIEKRLRLREKKYEIEQLMKEKRSEEMEALEEVFDKSTLMIVYRMLNRGKLTKIFGVVKAGKESRIYWALSPEGDVAVKIYLTTSAEFRRGMLPYIEGDPRFKRVKRDAKSIVYLWAQKEFKNLELAYASGVKVPKPFTVEGNVLTMEFIGENGVPAPLLKEVKLTNATAIYKELLHSLRLLYRRARLVHRDLSEYNVMIWKGKPVIFDISQAVTLEHPLADMLLRRDIDNLNNYFRKNRVKIKTSDEIYRWVVNESGD